MITAKKRYDDIPAGHRAPFHDGHCQFVHGHNYSFEFVFGCATPDSNGFVVDFGKLGCIKEFLVENFDHRLLISGDDPELAVFEELNLKQLCDLRVVCNSSAEGLAEMCFNYVSELILTSFGNRAWLVSVTVHEDSRNSATFVRK